MISALCKTSLAIYMVWFCYNTSVALKGGNKPIIITTVTLITIIL